MGLLHFKGYNGSVEYSEDDKCLHGKILGLKNSLVLYEGNSLEELREDFEDCVKRYLNRCKRNGQKPESPFNGIINIHIPSETHIKLAMYAENHGTSIDAFICDSIERRLEVVN